MSLRGPLHGQKQYLTKMLESYNITLQAVRFIESKGKKTTIYRFIYDTKRKYQEVIGSDGKTKYEDTRPYREMCYRALVEP